MKSIQDYYPQDVAHCYGCGRLNDHGHQLRTVWEGDETLTLFRPEPYHTAIPRFVYGGLLASVIDCHGTATAAAYLVRRRGIALDATDSGTLVPRFVTAALNVQYLRPTPLGPELQIRGRVTESSEKKVVVEAALSAEGVTTVRGEIVAVLMPGTMA